MEPTEPDNQPPGSDLVPRRRADWVHAREKILVAATELFARNGYRRTSTLELAEAAGVAEATLFRHFPTKALLFQDAVITRLRATMVELAERRRGQPSDRPTELATFDFYDEMLGVFRGDARLLIAALAALTFDPDAEEFHGLTSALADLLGYMDEVVSARTAERGFKLDPMIASRMMLAMVLGFALGDPLLFEPGSKPSQARLAAEMAKLTSYGFPGRDLQADRPSADRQSL